MIKAKKEIPTVIEWEGRTYVLQSAFKGGAKDNGSKKTSRT